MITAKQVPKECLVAYQRAFKAGGGPADGIAAALNAWPGMAPHGFYTANGPRDGIILPLTQESGEPPRRTLAEMRGVFSEAYKDNRNPRDE